HAPRRLSAHRKPLGMDVGAVRSRGRSQRRSPADGVSARRVARRSGQHLCRLTGDGAVPHPKSAHVPPPQRRIPELRQQRSACRSVRPVLLLRQRSDIMTNATEQVIQSARFLEGQGRITCVCCLQESFNNSGYCGLCRAPMEISRTAEKRGAPVNFVSVMGASGAGKTVFIGMLLDILSKGSRGIQGLPNNSFSVSIQQHTISALESRRFPEKTPSEAEG